MFKFAAFLVLVSAVIAGAKYSAAAINPTNRTYIIEYAKDLMIVSICIWHLDFFYNIVFDINTWVASEFKRAIGEQSLDVLNQVRQLPNCLWIKIRMIIYFKFLRC